VLLYGRRLCEPLSGRDLEWLASALDVAAGSLLLMELAPGIAFSGSGRPRGGRASLLLTWATAEHQLLRLGCVRVRAIPAKLRLLSRLICPRLSTRHNAFGTSTGLGVPINAGLISFVQTSTSTAEFVVSWRPRELSRPPSSGSNECHAIVRCCRGTRLSTPMTVWGANRHGSTARVRAALA